MREAERKIYPPKLCVVCSTIRGLLYAAPERCACPSLALPLPLVLLDTACARGYTRTVWFRDASRRFVCRTRLQKRARQRAIGGGEKRLKLNQSTLVNLCQNLFLTFRDYYERSTEKRDTCRADQPEGECMVRLRCVSVRELALRARYCSHTTTPQHKRASSFFSFFGFLTAFVVFGGCFLFFRQVVDAACVGCAHRMARMARKTNRLPRCSCKGAHAAL